MTITWWQFLLLGTVVLVLPQVVLAVWEARTREHSPEDDAESWKHGPR